MCLEYQHCRLEEKNKDFLVEVRMPYLVYYLHWLGLTLDAITDTTHVTRLQQ